MTAGDTDVQIATVATDVAIKVAVDAAITANGAASRLTICQLNNGSVVVVANLIA